jgi:hypothetical protein
MFLLDQGVDCGRFYGITLLVVLSAPKIVAARHPFTCRLLAEHDGVKLFTALDRQCAAALLGGVIEVDPGHQGLGWNGMPVCGQTTNNDWQQAF